MKKCMKTTPTSFYKSSPGRGISLIVLVITIVVTIILVSAVVISTRDSINNSRITAFANDIKELEDSAETYYLSNKVLPYPDAESTSLSKTQIIDLSGTDNITSLEEELSLNNDNGEETEFYYIDLAKLDVKRISNGLRADGANDVYVVAYPSLNVYYLKGIIVEGVRYFTITSKISNIQTVIGINGGDDDSSTSVIVYGGITVTKTNGWTNTMPITLRTNMEPNQSLYISILGIERPVDAPTGLYAKSFNILDLFTTNDILASTSFETEKDAFNGLAQTEKYMEIIKKDGDSNIIGKNRIDLSNYEVEVPQISDINYESYTNMNLINLKAIDNISKVREIRYDYLTKIAENGVETNYYPNIDNFDITYMKEEAKMTKTGANGNANINVPKNVRQVVLAVLDNAGNWVMETLTVQDMIYIGTKVDSATPESLKVTANVYSTNGVSSLKFSVSTDAQNYTGEQIFTYNTNDTHISQQAEYTGIDYTAAYVKVEATDNNPSIPNRANLSKVTPVTISGGTQNNPIELQNPEIVITPATATTEAMIIIDYFSAPIREYAITASMGDTPTWQTYSGPFSIQSNGVVWARGRNTSGGEKVSTLVVTNIDRTAPQNAVITVGVSGSNVTGTITMSDSGSGINLTNSKYIVTTTSTPYSVDNTIWYTTDAKSMTSNPRNISETKADGNYYIQTLSVDNAGNKRVNVSSVAIVHVKPENAPILTVGMTPIKWNGSSWINTTTSDTGWYNYGSKQWANAKTADGSMWVWIPRYEYKITTPHSNVAQVIPINFLAGTTTTVTSGYTLHPAFTFGSIQLTGIWVAKFEASGSTTAVNIVPGIASLRSLNVDAIFTTCRNMESNSRYGWGTSGTGFDTHMMKNIEWGACAYLSASQYGKNGTEVAINTSSGFYTGGGTGTAYVTNVEQSTTGNVYGIYDMSGGSFEYTAAYVLSANTTTKYGASLVSAAAQYKDTYTAGSGSATSTYSANATKKGDAIYETSSTTAINNLNYSWFGDRSAMPFNNSGYTNDNPFFYRGGAYNGGWHSVSGLASSGIFAFDCNDDYTVSGNASSNTSFRPAIAIASGL